MVLKNVRIILATLSFSLLTFFFVDFAGLFPHEQFTLATIQFVPALLANAFGILAALLIMTLLFGRVYCSVICPLGIFMDIITRIRKRFRPKMRHSYSREKKWLRFGTLILVIGAYIAGITTLLSLLDPYSAYGRIATHLFRPVYLAGNNALASLFNHFGNYSFYQVDIFTVSLVSLLTALATLLLIAVLAALYGRTWCNTICPVGTILGYLSKSTLFSIHIDGNTCTNCGLCEKSCKASCIDSSRGVIDKSRCVVCYDCLSKCRNKSITYRIGLRKRPQSNPQVTDQSKRRFFGTLATATLAVPTTLLAQEFAMPTSRTFYKKQQPLSPPGSVSFEHLLSHCTACHLCVAKCPTRILKPSLLEYGAAGIMLPRMDFEHGFCNYDCTLCSEICPNDALYKLTKEEKHRVQMGRVIFVKNNCVVYTDETSCGACSEHCPTQAVSMVPYKGALTIPSVNQDICVGCGGCEYVCPAKPLKAIYVEGNPVHLQAKPFEEKEKSDIILDGFGF